MTARTARRPAVSAIGPGGDGLMGVRVRLGVLGCAEGRPAVSAIGRAGEGRKGMPIKLGKIARTERRPAAPDPEEGAR
jgi:hypothetical protein